jgi:predicted esterase YcpF (UPF0227 family)
VKTSHLLYLHGFRSSPRSTKAQRFEREIERLRAIGRAPVWLSPQLPPSPAQAMALIEAATRDWPAQSMAVIGSSLGGFYATALAERRGCAAVVLNPAVDPARDLAGFIGEQTAWHDPQQHFHFRPEFIDELRAIDPGPLADPAHYMAVIAKGDEVLDWREMQARYAGSHMCLIDGSDHALSDFDTHLPAVLRFLGLA